jgi:acetylglutamate synthase
MGKVKLTLTVEEQVVIDAKRLMRKNQQSLSAMIEQLITTATTAAGDSVGNKPKAMSNALTLRGIAKGSLSCKTDKQIRDIMHKDRYGLWPSSWQSYHLRN